jgi:hypothetical protein
MSVCAMRETLARAGSSDEPVRLPASLIRTI